MFALDCRKQVCWLNYRNIFRWWQISGISLSLWHEIICSPAS